MFKVLFKSCKIVIVTPRSTCAQSNFLVKILFFFQSSGNWPKYKYGLSIEGAFRHVQGSKEENVLSRNFYIPPQRPINLNN